MGSRKKIEDFKTMVKKTISKSMSLAGWDLLTYVKDRRKGVIAAIAGAIAYAITNSELSAVLAGVVFEGLVSVAEFYLRDVEIKK